MLEQPHLCGFTSVSKNPDNVLCKRRVHTHKNYPLNTTRNERAFRNPARRFHYIRSRCSPLFCAREAHLALSFFPVCAAFAVPSSPFFFFFFVVVAVSLRASLYSLQLFVAAWQCASEPRLAPFFVIPMGARVLLPRREAETDKETRGKRIRRPRCG